jgi:hypothetical protein
MAYRVAFSPDEALAVVELSGPVSFDDVAAAMCAVFGHPGWVPSFSVLWDARAATAACPAPADLPGARGLMEALAAARDGGRSAVLVRREAEGALAEALVGLGPPTSRAVRVFYVEGEAVRYLGRRSLPAGLPVVAASAGCAVVCAGAEERA